MRRPGWDGVPDPADVLVDERFGIVRRLLDDPRRGGMPCAQHQWVAHMSDTTAFHAPPVDRVGFGNALDEVDARGAALGEAVERYCGNLVPPGLRVACFDALYSHGWEALDPSGLALFSPAQYAERGFPFCPFTGETVTAWTGAHDLTTGRTVLVPASLVYLNVRDVPATNPLVYAGIAAGPSPASAQLAALHEIVERDATAIWWAAGGPTLRIRDADAVVAEFDDIHADERIVRILAVPNQFDLPVVVAFVQDQHRRLIGFGTACHPDARRAARKALTEAFGLLEVAADLSDPRSPLWDAYHRKLLPNGLFRPFRADRAYADSYRRDFRDLADLPAVAQLYLDPRMQDRPLARLRAEDGTVGFDQLDRTLDHSPGRTLDDALARFRDAGLRALSVDVTTDDVAAAGLRVVRVIAPGAYSNSPPAFPLFGGRRLRDVPVALGWRSAPLPDSALVRTPIPLG